MYHCIDCDRDFDQPKKHVETHGLPCPPYEEFYGCPYCGGDFEEKKENEE